MRLKHPSVSLRGTSRILGASALALVLSAGIADTASANNSLRVIQPSSFSTSYTFRTLDDTTQTIPVDGNFNQLLGINNDNVIVGYDGDGTIEPNKGYVLVPADHYSGENFPDSFQTQVIGINTGLIPVNVGFWIDGKGNNFGFSNHNGVFVKVEDPHTGTFGGIKTNQLLGVNDHDVAVGFYLDSKGNAHGYTYNVDSKEFTGLTLSNLGTYKITSFMATGINNDGVIVGSATTSTGVTVGFYGTEGDFTGFSVGNTTAVSLLGINNKGVAVGVATDSNGVSEGVVYSISLNTGAFVNDPLNKPTAAFGVNGTTINGINDAGDIVGFFSDGHKVHGFLGIPN